MGTQSGGRVIMFAQHRNNWTFEMFKGRSGDLWEQNGWHPGPEDHYLPPPTSHLLFEIYLTVIYNFQTLKERLTDREAKVIHSGNRNVK